MEGHRVLVRAGSGLPATDPNSGLLSATLAQNAGLNARIALPEAIAAGRHCRSILKAIAVTSVDANVWEFWFWRNSRFQQTGHPDQEDFAGWYLFGAAGKQIAGTGLAYAYADGLNLVIEDEEAGANPAGGGFLNVTLVNRSAGAKTANGWFFVTFALEPTVAF
jgi:hypothetical protein